MTDDLRQRLNEAFAIEHREHIGALRALLARAEMVGWQLDREEKDELHRRLHSFKGAARAMDYRPLEKVMHRAESLVARIQSGALALDADIAAGIEAVLDEAETWIGMALAGGTPGPLDRSNAWLSRWDGAEANAPVAPASQPKPARDAPVREAEPSENVRVDVKLLDAILTRAGDLGAEAERERGAIAELRALVESIEGTGRELERSSGADSVAALKEGVARLRDIAGTLADANWRVRRDGVGIDRAAHESRLVAAEAVLFDLARQARQIAHDERKDIAVHVSGLEVRADRGVLHALKDPLLHLVRNAVVHGIEAPDARRAAGKTARGNVSVTLGLRGRALQLRVADDGQGIDAAAVDDRARALGLLGADDSAAEGDASLLRLILRAGLSTAAEVSELSGRGMGLSVVHEAARRLGGYIEAASEPGAGTTFTLSVPSVVARRRLLTFMAGGGRYALPLDCVRQVRRAPAGALVAVEGRWLVRDAGAELVAVALGPLAADGPLRLIEVQLAGERRYALVVEEFGVIVDRIVEDSGLAGAAGEAVIGCATIDGRVVAPVLDPAWLQTLGAGEGTVSITARATAAKAPAAKPTVLIADDSITTRTLEKSLLEARGYRVLVATDGHEALATLGHAPVDVVVADIEMPRTDGFALVEEMKGDARFAAIPVILVTSRDADSDRRRGLALGADAYIVKQRFDERELVETIEQLV